MSKWIEFDIHGQATMRVDRDAPTAALFHRMFGPFLAEGLSHHDLTVTGRLKPMGDVSYAEEDFQYTANAVYLPDTKEQILLDEDGFHLNGTRELLVSALPLIDRILVMRGVAMIHAATVDYDGRGICLPAWGGVGKTSTIAKLLKLDGVSFMGDDWAFLTDGGELLGYEKPMFIKPHHRPIYPHLFDRRRKPLVPRRLSKAARAITTRVHPFLTQYPRLAHAARRLSPEYMVVTPRQAFPVANFSSSAPLALAMFVERFEGSAPVLEEKDRSWMVSRMVGNFHAEMTQHSRELITALGASGLVPIEQAFSEKAKVIADALSEKPTFLLRVPRAFPADRASDVIVDHLHRVLARAESRVA